MARPPAAARVLTNVQLLEIERMSKHGLGAATIATRIGLTDSEFFDAAKADPRVEESMRYGRASGITAMAAMLFSIATTDRDISAAKFYLERVGGAEWKPARAPAPQVTIVAPLVPIDQEGMRRRFERQSRLLDGTCSELTDDAAPAADEATNKEELRHGRDNH